MLELLYLYITDNEDIINEVSLQIRIPLKTQPVCRLLLRLHRLLLRLHLLPRIRLREIMHQSFWPRLRSMLMVRIYPSHNTIDSSLISFVLS